MYRRQSVQANSFMLRSLQPGGAKLMLGEGRGGWTESFWSYLGWKVACIVPEAAYRSPAFNSTAFAVVGWWPRCRDASQDSSLSSRHGLKWETAHRAAICLLDSDLPGKYICSRIWSCREKLQRTGDQLPKSSWNNHTEINLYQERTAVLLQDEFSSAIFCHATFPVLHLVAIQPRASWQPWVGLAHCIGLSYPALLPGRPT